MGVGWTDRAGLFAAFLVAALPVASPASAFGALEEAVMQLPEDVLDVGGGWVFDFASPRVTDELGINSVSVGRAQLATAILNPFPARALTGIDFRGLDAVLVFGELPTDLVYLSGPRIDGDEIAEALTARGFERSGEAGVPVFARGEDGAVDPPEADPLDPFGAALGRSQRIAVGDGRVLVAPAWPPLRAVLPFDAGPANPAADVLGQMVVAARRSARPMTGAYYATAYTIAAFASTRDVRDGLDLFAVEVLREPTMPVFTVALIVAAGSRDHETAELVLAYPDRASAEAGIAEVARRLETGHDEPMMRPVFRVSVHDAEVDGEPFAIGVASVMYMVAPAGAGRFEANRWAEQIYLRQFEVLDLFD